MILDYMKMALSNLLHRRLRSWLTLIGIFIGITAVVALVSLGQGLDYAITAEFLELGADKIFISAQSPVGNSAGQDTANQLGDRDLAAAERTLGVLRVVPYWQRSARISWGDAVGYYPVIGGSDNPVERKVLEDSFTLHIDQGRGLESGDSSKAIIGAQLVDPDVISDPMKIGDKITIDGTRFEVVGIYEPMGDPLADQSIYISDDAMREVFDVGDTYDMLIAQIDASADPEIVGEDLRRSLVSARGLNDGEEDFDIQTPKDLVDSFRQVFGIVQTVIIGIALIALLVGAVGIMNTMYTSVLERTKEIGIMKAIGAKNTAILTIFLVESGLLGLLGGLIGLLSGMALAKSVEVIGTLVLGTNLLKALFPWWLVVGSLAFAFILGVLSGILPARQASKQQAVDSLRYE